MSSDKRCCVPGCKEIGGMHQVLHGFPNPERDRERFNTWLYAIGSDILFLENERIFKYRRVCRSHFEDKYLCRNNKISNIAVPTLNMPAPFSNKQRTPALIRTRTDLSNTQAGTTATTYTTAGPTLATLLQAAGTKTTKRPDWKDQAAAKQGLNETTTPRGDHKRPRLDQSKRATKRSYAQAASATLDVAITCGRTGILSKDISDRVLTAIQKQIILEARSPQPDTPGPTFNAKPVFTGGVIKLWCGNNHTLAWLKETVPALSLVTSISLVVKSQPEIERRAQCGIVIPDDQGVFEEPTDIGRALSYQNPWVDIKRWVLLHVNKQAAAWFVVVGVPMDQIPALMRADRRLSIGVGTVYIRFQGQDGRYTNAPHGWNSTTGTISEATLQRPVTPAASCQGEDGFDEGDLPAGLRLGKDDEVPPSDVVPFVNLWTPPGEPPPQSERDGSAPHVARGSAHSHCPDLGAVD